MTKSENVLAGSGLIVAAAWWLMEPTTRGGAEAAAILVMLVLLSRLLANRNEGLRALRRAVAREHVLSELGTALITATVPAEVHRLAVTAAGELLAECPGARVSVLETTDGGFAVADSAGAGTAAVVGRQVPVASAPPELLARLTAGEVVEVADMSEQYADAGEAHARPYTLMPLRNGDRFLGVLSVSADGELPSEVFQALQALRTQVSLALASVALTAELTERALHDPLTGLANRALLRERLTVALSRSRRSGRPVGALLLDLNGFKQVNDVHGHAAGDDLLKVVADRLRGCVRTEDVVGRLGGDEFVIIAEDLRSARDAMVIADRVVAALNEAVPVGRRQLSTPASVGIALSHAGIKDPDELLRMADTAMYTAKRRGGGSYELHGAPSYEPSPVVLPAVATLDRRRPKLPV
ncbi:GGDEF domain-containing protein [Paractinoplanes atraurantiacus]|uniref:Diguanylate cyclase (GGDEF) domain-containing protein n=1 Tax=Paractinoplanes atraurantiacus TaxID=1036182 RepID=A0A285JHY0_9ACTN|nr:GGDEF domain-containing protein [Actinoplanes atraurantiacus]SNY59909.1 diguanylate cyclase (GGDEF) domain-containing protein [Actinoplanes atraurantiacus]